MDFGFQRIAANSRPDVRVWILEAAMSQLIPEPGTGPPSMRHQSPEQRIEGWIDLMQFGDECFLAGLEHRLQPGQDELTAARASYARYMEEQDRKLLRMARCFGERDGC